MYKIDQLTEIDLGVVQENEATEIQIDVNPWLKKWPDGIFAVNVCRPGEMEPYPANCRVEDGMLYWLVTEGELAIAGNGRCDIRLYQGTVKKKTRIAITRIHETLPGSTQEAPPDAAQGWLDSLNETRAEVESNTKAAKESAAQAAASEGQAQGHAQSAAESANAAETAKESAETAWQNIQTLDAEAETLAPEEAATAEYNKALNKLLFGIPKGNKGDKGDQGVSPTVTVSKTGKVTTVTITDKDGTKTFYINDGVDGEGAGDMLKSTYDADGDGVVDKAESATYATNAGIASRANSAASADTAHSATNATNAVNAENASKLGNELPSAYRKTADLIDYQTDVTNKPTIPTVDAAVTEGSANAVSSGAVKTYVDGKVGSYPKVTIFNVPTAQHNDGATDLTPPYTFPLMVDNVAANDVIDVRVDYDSTLILEDKATYREAMRNAIISVDSMVDMGEGSYIIYLVCDGEFPTSITNMVFKIINYGAGVTA